MPDILLLSLLLVVVLICSLLAILFVKKRAATRSRTPAGLANQLYRYPERMLIDVPLYASAAEGTDSYDFLLATEAELASIGELESRRQFLIRFAEVVKLPSKASLEKLTDFLLRDAPVLFRETLRWEGRCNGAIHFLESTSWLIEVGEKRKNLKDFPTHLKNLRNSKNRKKRSSKNLSNDLDSVDVEIMREWNDLNNAIHRTVSTLREKKGYKITNDESSHSSLLRLVEDDKVPHLTPFLIATRAVLEDVLQSMLRAK